MTPSRLIGILVLALLGAEAWALRTPAPGDTISEIVWALNDRWPIVALAFGVLMGHFFWPRKR